MTMIRRFNSGEKDHLMKTSTNIVPNRLHKDIISEVEQKMQTHTESLNAVLYNATLDAFHTDLQKTKQTCLKENPKIVAKAWRTVKLSNRNVKELSFRKEENLLRNTDQPRIRQTRHDRDDSRNLNYTDRPKEPRDETHRRQSYRVYSSRTRRPHIPEDTDSMDEYHRQRPDYRQHRLERDGSDNWHRRDRYYRPPEDRYERGLDRPHGSHDYRQTTDEYDVDFPPLSSPENRRSHYRSRDNREYYRSSRYDKNYLN